MAVTANDDAGAREFEAELSAGIDETITSLSSLRESHRNGASALQRAITTTTDGLSRPAVVVGLTCGVLAWIGANCLLLRFGQAWDPPPFFWLDAVLSLISVYMLFMVLASQRTEDQLTRRRELLSLELAVRSEQKTAKVIALLEELRRDMPQLPDRWDSEAEKMARPANPASVIGVIQEKRLDEAEGGVRDN